jgi:hypothetical protein
MLWWIIQVTVISVLLIFLVHHLIDFFKTTLTVPKIKDLVKSPTRKYEDMYHIIQQHGNGTSQKEEYSLIDLLPTNEEDNMKSELKNFLKSQLQTS